MGKAVRLDKFLADSGAGTRTEVKKLIQKGMVQVNGETAKKPELKVDPERDVVEFGGERLGARAEFVYYLLHKPAGYVSATEDIREKTVLIGTILFSFLVVSEFMKTPVYGADLGNCQYRQSDELESFESLFSDTAASAQEATGYYAQKILIPVVIFCFAALAVIFAIVKITSKVDMLKRYFDVWKNHR